MAASMAVCAHTNGGKGYNLRRDRMRPKRFQDFCSDFTQEAREVPVCGKHSCQPCPPPCDVLETIIAGRDRHCISFVAATEAALLEAGPAEMQFAPADSWDARHGAGTIKSSNYAASADQQMTQLHSADNITDGMSLTAAAHTGRKCLNCGTASCPANTWRAGPAGPKTLCNACGLRFKRCGAALHQGHQRVFGSTAATAATTLKVPAQAPVSDTQTAAPAQQALREAPEVSRSVLTNPPLLFDAQSSGCSTFASAAKPHEITSNAVLPGDRLVMGSRRPSRLDARSKLMAAPGRSSSWASLVASESAEDTAIGKTQQLQKRKRASENSELTVGDDCPPVNKRAACCAVAAAVEDSRGSSTDTAEEIAMDIDHVHTKAAQLLATAAPSGQRIRTSKRLAAKKKTFHKRVKEAAVQVTMDEVDQAAETLLLMAGFCCP